MKISQFIWIILTFILAYLAVLINHDNLAEQIVFTDYHLVLGRSIWDGNGYHAYYPLWGYPFFVGLIDKLFVSSRDLLITIIQVSLIALACWWVVLPKINNFRQLLLAPLFFPIYFHAAVKWADAIFILGLVILLKSIDLYSKHKRSSILVIVSVSAIASNIRPDFLFLSGFVFLISLLYFAVSRWKESDFLKISCILLLSSFLSLVPWFIYSGSFTSANGGLVFYISLGQLPDNPWDRVYIDQSGFDFAQSMNTHPYSPEGNKILFHAGAKDISTYPIDYIRKTLHNLISIFTFGIFGMNFPLFFLVFSILFFVSTRRYKGTTLSFINSVFLFTIIWISMIQYIDRHLNGVYTLMLLQISTTLFHPLSQQVASPPKSQIKMPATPSN